MKQLCLAILLCLFTIQASSQYYLRGEVRDDKGKPVPNAKLLLQSKGAYVFYTGPSGAFGIPVSVIRDSITISADGFGISKTLADATKFQTISLKPLSTNVTAKQNGLISFTKNLFVKEKNTFSTGNETYNNLVENDFITAEKYPETGFALSIDRASYSNVRRFLNLGNKVPPDAVRIEEMLNYFNLKYSDDNIPNRLFTCHTYVTSAPWNNLNQLFFVHMQAPKLNLDSIPPTNFVFLIDVSGSMDKDNRLPLLKSSFKLLVKNLREQDSVSIVVYGGVVGIMLQPTSGKEKDKIIETIEKLQADGETPGAAAIKMAYDLAERSFNKQGNNRVILATDGDFNVGQNTEKELEDLITAHKQSGIYLTCLGVGMGNYKDSKLETLAKKGNGNFAYIDNLQEGEKVLITEFSKTVYAVATDAFLTVKFNPLLVKNYRLIGFDNKKDATQNSSDNFEGGEVGSGHSLVAVFEIVPTEKNVSQEFNYTDTDFATLRLQFKQPASDTLTIQNFHAPLTYVDLQQADSSLRFATAITMFGSLLKQSDYAKNYNWDDVKSLAASALDPKDVLENEFLDLVEKAKKIYGDKKKKK